MAASQQIKTKNDYEQNAGHLITKVVSWPVFRTDDRKDAVVKTTGMYSRHVLKAGQETNL